MLKQTVFLTLFVVVLPLAAFAQGEATSSFLNMVMTLPEPGTLGLLGTGLIGLAVVLRRKLRLNGGPDVGPSGADPC